MNTIQIQQHIFEHAKSTSQKNLAEHGWLQPVAISESGVLMLPRDKGELRTTIAELTKAPWFVLVQEVWIATANPTDDRLPSEREDRTEGIIIMLIVNGKQVKSAQCGFRRSKEGDIFFEDWIASGAQIQLVPVQGGSLEAIA